MVLRHSGGVGVPAEALVERLFEAVLGFNDLHSVYLGDDYWRFYRLER